MFIEQISSPHSFSTLLEILGPKPHNFSNYQLSHSENILGLNFRPTPKAIPIHTLKKPTDEFSRSIRLKHYFCDRNLDTGLYHPKLLCVQTGIHRFNCQAYIEIPLLALRYDLCSLKPLPHKPNLSHSELLSLSTKNSNLYLCHSVQNKVKGHIWHNHICNE